MLEESGLRHSFSRRGSFVEYGDTPQQRQFWRAMDVASVFVFLAVLVALEGLRVLAEDRVGLALWIAAHVARAG